MPKFFPGTKQVEQNKKYWEKKIGNPNFVLSSITLKKKKKVLKLLVLKTSTTREALAFHSRGKHCGIPETQAEFISRQHFPP